MGWGLAWFIGAILLGLILYLILNAFDISKTIIFVVVGIIELIVYPLILLYLHWSWKHRNDPDD